MGVILVNDGSLDGSWDRIEALAAADDRVRGLDLTRNFGQHNALLAGTRPSRNESWSPWTTTSSTPRRRSPSYWPRSRPAPTSSTGSRWSEPSLCTGRLVAASARSALRLTEPAEAANFTGFRALRAHLRDRFAGPQGRRVSVDALLRR